MVVTTASLRCLSTGKSSQRMQYYKAEQARIAARDTALKEQQKQLREECEAQRKLGKAKKQQETEEERKRRYCAAQAAKRAAAAEKLLPGELPIAHEPDLSVPAPK